jgi:hypothetical protein
VHSPEKVETAEREAILDLAELGDAILIEPRERIPLTSRLVGAADRAALHSAKLLAGVIAERVETRVQAVNVFALSLDLG